MTTPSNARRNVNRAKTVLAALQALAGSLPSDEERDRAKKALDQLIEFLQSARVALDGLPTQGDLGSLRRSLDQLTDLFGKAVDSPAVSAALGMEPVRSPARAKTVRPPAPSAEDLERFRDLTIDQMRELLNDESKFTVSKLHELARSLGARVNSRSGREAIANQILTKITNVRGYQQLSNPSDSAEGTTTRDV